MPFAEQKSRAFGIAKYRRHQELTKAICSFGCIFAPEVADLAVTRQRACEFDTVGLGDRDLDLRSGVAFGGDGQANVFLRNLVALGE